MKSSFSITALLVTLYCKQVCDYLLEDTLAEDEVKVFLGQYYDMIKNSIMSKETDAFIQHFVLANQGKDLSVAINQFMLHVTGLMTRMAGVDLQKTVDYNSLEGGSDEESD